MYVLSLYTVTSLAGISVLLPYFTQCLLLSSSCVGFYWTLVLSLPVCNPCSLPFPYSSISLLNKDIFVSFLFLLMDSFISRCNSSFAHLFCSPFSSLPYLNPVYLNPPPFHNLPSTILRSYKSFLDAGVQFLIYSMAPFPPRQLNPSLFMSYLLFLLCLFVIVHSNVCSCLLTCFYLPSLI